MNECPRSLFRNRGFSLGFEAVGMHTAAFCECDPYAQAVLRKHWPNTTIHPDIRTLDGSEYADSIDVVCGGFPCQDISLAGKRSGITGERSGLYREILRTIRVVRPK